MFGVFEGAEFLLWTELPCLAPWRAASMRKGRIWGMRWWDSFHPRFFVFFTPKVCWKKVLTSRFWFSKVELFSGQPFLEKNTVDGSQILRHPGCIYKTSVNHGIFNYVNLSTGDRRISEPSKGMIHLLIHFSVWNPSPRNLFESSSWGSCGNFSDFSGCLSLGACQPFPTKHLKQTPNKKTSFFFVGKWSKTCVCFFFLGGWVDDFWFEISTTGNRIDIYISGFSFHIKLESSVLGDQLIFFWNSQKRSTNTTWIYLSISRVYHCIIRVPLRVGEVKVYQRSDH